MSSTSGPAKWDSASLECDIVMKGGITSGVVYPGAAVSLARRYRFRSIGGASAGAIAAAIVAAAEYGRADGGFDRLADVPYELSATNENGDSFLLQLFRPDTATKELFDAALGFLRYGPWRGLLQLRRSFPYGFSLAAAAVALGTLLGATGAAPLWVAVLIIALAPWLCVGVLIQDLRRAVGAISANDFGLCRLGPAPAGDSPALTQWLHRVIQEASGRPLDKPLTFADLWGLPPLTGKETPEELEKRDEQVWQLGWAAGERKLDLQVMTTNLTNGRPMRLPVGRDRYSRVTGEDGGGLLFDPDEWRGFFPAEVVEHMVARSPQTDDERATHLADLAPGRTLHRFPGGGELPVLVAARMSLSFPILISAIPLWRLRYPGGKQRPSLMRVFFSDGGISSNFPVHFFDAPLPMRPTFALNLGGFARDEHPNPDVPAENVVDPPAPNKQAPESWTEIDSLFAFIVSIKDAMENWRDNTQGRLPGFRERIIDIKLGHGEGGLNLAMDEEKITRLTERGAYAGDRLKALFSGDDDDKPAPTKHWNDSRFTRFRVTMSVIEEALRAISRGYTAPPDAVTVSYPQRVAAGGVAPYRLTAAELKLAEDTIDEYLDLVAGLGKQTLSDDNVPRPTAVLRLTPPV
jgi:predicted acylesterase/phospholipase RssA